MIIEKSKISNFFDHRFIPFENVEKIIYINENGKENTNLFKDIEGGRKK
jgi:hypothetical protein